MNTSKSEVIADRKLDRKDTVMFIYTCNEDDHEWELTGQSLYNGDFYLGDEYTCRKCGAVMYQYPDLY